jgi:hypothetical protein
MITRNIGPCDRDLTTTEVESYEAADAVFMASEYADRLEDPAGFDLELGGWVYWLADASTVVITEAGEVRHIDEDCVDRRLPE